MHGRTKTRIASTQAIEFDLGCSGETHSNMPCADLKNVDIELCVFLEYSVTLVKFVHWAARMPNSDKLCNSFRARNKRVSRFQSNLASSPRVSKLSMQNVARVQKTSISQGEFRSLVATGRMSVGVRRWHLVTMRKASLRTLSMRQVCPLRHQAGAQYSAVELIMDNAAERNVLPPAPHPEPESRLSSETRVDSFLRNASR